MRITFRVCAAVWFLCALLLIGCSVPRLFTSKVPAPVTKQEVQVEAERQAADLIARKIETPIELKPVAAQLSASLGSPTKSLVDVKVFDLPTASKTATSDLNAGIIGMQEQLKQVNLRLAKLQGKEIEGTGISLLGPGMATVVIGLIALGVIFPPAFTVMGILYRRMKQTTGFIVDRIDQAAKAPETAAAVSKIKDELKGDMDTVHKRIVQKLQGV